MGLFTLADMFLSVAAMVSPGLAVPEASTTSLVLPPDGGLKGDGPDVPSAPARSHGFGGAPVEKSQAHIFARTTNANS